MIEIIVAAIFFLAVLFIILSFASFIKSTEIKKAYGIPKGKITYTDLDKPGKALYSRKYNLAGKPDYIVKRDYGYIPIEVKNTETNYPYRSHVMQLASYCLLLEDSGKSVPFGVISYRNGQFKIPFDEDLKNEVREIIEKIRNEISLGRVERNHNQLNKCNFCSLRKFCSYTMT